MFLRKLSKLAIAKPKKKEIEKLIEKYIPL
jgi:hypothetical protein